MLDMKWIRQNQAQVRQAIHQKGVDLNLDDLIRTDQLALDILKEIQVLEEEKNRIAKKVPVALASEKVILIKRGKQVGKEIEQLRARQRIAEEALQELFWLVPNLPAPEAPIGNSDAENVEIKRWGETPRFDFTPHDHVQILENHNWADFQRVTKVAGSRSYSLKNEMVLLELALWRFALDQLRGKGFNLVTTPALAREFAFYGTGHFPTGKGQVYFLPADDLYLAGTSEVLLNALHGGEILKDSDLPLLYAGMSPCFRREAGSAGRDTRGLIRVHQFTKIEQFVICRNDPEESRHWHMKLLQAAEEIVQALELPYRVVDTCTADMGAGKVRMYDIETWVPSEGKYRETHSCSMLYEWQARRINLRYRGKDDKLRYCHTLNNTAVATPRILVPLIENHQQRDGSIRIPAVLRAYMGGTTQIPNSLPDKN